jgi:hypothetical protein
LSTREALPKEERLLLSLKAFLFVGFSVALLDVFITFSALQHAGVLSLVYHGGVHEGPWESKVFFFYASTLYIIRFYGALILIF